MVNIPLDIPSPSAAHNSSMVGTIRIFYDQKNGFILDDDEVLPSQFIKKEQEEKLCNIMMQVNNTIISDLKIYLQYF